MAADDVLTKEEIAQAAKEFSSAIVDQDTLFLEEVDGRREFLVFEDDRTKLTVYHDLTAIQDENRRLYNNPVDHKSEFREKARFPTSFLDVYGNQRGLPMFWYNQKQYTDELVALANNPDYRDFRVSPGVIGLKK